MTTSAPGDVSGALLKTKTELKMRYLKGIPEDILKATFAYDPASPSGLVRLQISREKATRISAVKNEKSLNAHIRIKEKLYQKRFSFGRNGKSEMQAKLDARDWVLATEKKNPQLIRPAGNMNKQGYWGTKIRYKGRPIDLRVNRIVFFLCTEVDIEGVEVDHIDNNRSNNKIENLRASTSSQNGCNRRISKASRTGVKGLHDIKEKHSWIARVTVGRVPHVKNFNYGIDSTEEHKEKLKADAIAWLVEERNRIHGAFTNNG